MLIIIILVTLVNIYLIFRWRRRRFYELAAKLPGSDGLPFIGSVHEFYGLEYKEYFFKSLELTSSMDTKINKLWLGPKLFVAIDSPEAVQDAFKSPHCTNKPSYFYGKFYAKYGILSINGSLYDKHRKILSKSFMPNMLKQIVPVFNEKAKVCIKKLEEHLDGREFDVSSFVGACTIETFAAAHLNFNENFYKSKVLHALESSKPYLAERIFQPILHFDSIFKLTKLSKKLNEILDCYNKVIYDIIKKNESCEINYDSNPIVINQLMNPKSQLTNEEIKDEVFLFVLAGFETSALSVSATILMLAIHQDVQQKIHQEIDEVIGKGDVMIDSEIINNLPYLEMVIKESMRLFPIAGFLARETTEEVELEGYLVPKDSILLLSIYKMHRNPKYWGDDAHLFRPERFAPENLENININAFVPFSGGKRICLGYKYAWQFMKIYLAHFFINYKITSSLKYEELTTEISPSLSIVQNYMISLKKR